MLAETIETIDIRKMSMTERLALMDRLLDSLTPDSKFNPSPRWHQAVLSERVAAEQRGEVSFMPLNLLRRMLRDEGKCR